MALRPLARRLVAAAPGVGRGVATLGPPTGAPTPASIRGTSPTPRSRPTGAKRKPPRPVALTTQAAVLRSSRRPRHHPGPPVFIGPPGAPQLFREHFDPLNEFNLAPPTAPRPLITTRQRRRHRLRVAHPQLQAAAPPKPRYTDDPLEGGEHPEVGARARALIHAALRERPGFVGHGAVFPVVIRRQTTFSTAATQENIRKINDQDSPVTLRVQINGLRLSLQAKRRLSALCPPEPDGLLTIAAAKYRDPWHNEQHAKSALTQLVNEALRADHGSEHWVEAVVKAPPYATQATQLREVEQKAVGEEEEALLMLQRWSEARRESAVPVFADAMYAAYVGDRTVEQLLKEKDAERRSKAAKEEDDAGYTLI